MDAGLTSRPLRHGEEGAVTAVMAADELDSTGEVVIEEADIVSDWQQPSFDVAAQTIGVFEGDTLVGYAEVGKGGRGDGAVLPSHRGRGIGTFLAQWMQATARARGESVVGMPVPQGSPGEVLLRALGYHQRWESWVFVLPEGREISAQPLPEGYAIRTAEESDAEAVWTVVEDAFLEWADRERERLDDFLAKTWKRPGFEPWNMRVATDAAGDVVGVSFLVLGEQSGYVEKLAVRRDQRGLGLARALLADSFAQARAHGATRSELSTDSRTGARSLYERVGMEVTSTWVNLAIEL